MVEATENSRADADETLYSVPDETIFSEDHSESRTINSDSSEENLQIGEDETRAVNRVRVVVLLVLLSVAATVSSTVSQYSRQQERKDFRNQFKVHAEKVISDISATTERSLKAIEDFAIQITIYAKDQHLTWPNVALSDFEARARITIDLAKATSLIFIPLVTDDTRPSWEKFSVHNQGWLSHGLALQKFISNEDENERESIQQLQNVYGKDEDFMIPRSIFKLNNRSMVMAEDGRGPYAPLWQFAPAFPISSLVNLNTISLPGHSNEIAAAIKSQKTTVGKAYDYAAHNDTRSAVLNLFLNRGNSQGSYTGGPVSDLYSPIFEHFGQNKQIVGFLTSYVYWQLYFENILPGHVNGIIAVLENNCNQTFTFMLNGAQAQYVGEGDLHDPHYDALEVSTGFGEIFHQDINDWDTRHCMFNIRIFPSPQMENDILSSTPMLFAILLISTFIVTSMVFLWYQSVIDRRQMVVMNAAVQSTAVVQSLFPANVRARLLEENQAQQPKRETANYLRKDNDGNINKLQKPTVLTSENIFGSKPIADLFPNTTVMFADMVGFTAWASVREPAQVFTLLEIIYHEFDMLGKRMRIFKVETIGDCYVAAAGLPTPRKNHAVVMAKFAWYCRYGMEHHCRELETSLGPDTAELGLRIGLHSGPVTAGVLRGDKGRFQLFGDTVNTASRMESTGRPGRIQVSRDTADLLIAAGRCHWVIQREDKVVAKGKGDMQTYWLVAFGDSAGSSCGDSIRESTRMEAVGLSGERRSSIHEEDCEKTRRLVHWNVDILSRLLKQIVARRNSRSSHMITEEFAESLHIETAPGKTVLDEVKDVITLPDFDSESYKIQTDIESIQLPHEVNEQLITLVSEIAGMYRHNPFHCFEHAGHVMMSVTKLMSRIDSEIAANPHEHTFSIMSDPLTQFACAFAAIIHDLDHPGVTNTVLVEEKSPLALKYKSQSVAEQNSVDLAWDLLNQTRFEELRSCIYADMDELIRFRQLVVNVVMATDIMDKDLCAQRKARWAKAFSDEAREDVREDVNRKVTIVIEHLIQASDVAHTMQHWHIYKKWNERLFHETYRAYKVGRLPTNPLEFWYRVEIGFFDYYIIPLAKKLETCGVFGVSSDEYLNYALANRREWEEKGEELVKGYVESYNETNW